MKQDEAFNMNYNKFESNLKDRLETPMVNLSNQFFDVEVKGSVTSFTKDLKKCIKNTEKENEFDDSTTLSYITLELNECRDEIKKNICQSTDDCLIDFVGNQTLHKKNSSQNINLQTKKYNS